MKLLLAGATTVQVCSAMYEQGIGTIRTMNHFLNSWMDKKGFESIDEFRGRIILWPMQVMLPAMREHSL